MFSSLREQSKLSVYTLKYFEKILVWVHVQLSGLIVRLYSFQVKKTLMTAKSKRRIAKKDRQKARSSIIIYELKVGGKIVKKDSRKLEIV